MVSLLGKFIQFFGTFIMKTRVSVFLPGTRVVANRELPQYTWTQVSLKHMNN